MKKQRTLPKQLHTIFLSTLFLGGFLLLVVFGAGIYRRIYSIQQESSYDRALLGYLNTSLKAERTAALILDESKQILRIQDRDAPEYAKTIYLHEGSLREEYILLDQPLLPDGAIEIAGCSSFVLHYHKDRHLLEIVTSEGTIWINTGLREVVLYE